MGIVLTSNDICKNCKFYQQLYTKVKTRFKTAMGRCTNEQKTARNTRKFLINSEYCEFWEQGKDKMAEQDKCIREVISDIHTKLTQILEILEAEE